ncbi:MAG: hypothetical protein U0229_05085 [Anaeromyxobacter sp.]
MAGREGRAFARGTVARYAERSCTVEMGVQSPIPGRQASESGVISPPSHFFFTSASGSGPTCA